VRAKDPCLAEAVCSGMRWLVISRDAVDRWPSLPQVIQSAANSANHLSTGESELQLARKILAKWKDQSGDGKRMITWSDISKSVLQSKPSQSMTCPAIFAFVLSFGGGRASDWLFGTESFVRSHGHPDKNLGFDVWDSLSTVTKTGKQRMRLRHALLKLAYFGPNDRIVTPGDCRKLLSGKDMQSKVDQCEAILSELHEITKKHTCSKEKCIQLLGMAECKVVATLLQKKHRDIPWSFDSMEEAAYEFI
ncbi:Putative mitochondrial protein, partial [Durusdinium trenchii]